MTKTRKFLIVSHGALAGGFRSALELITGASGDVFVLQAYLEENKPVEEELVRLLQGAGEGEEWVVFTDLLGGSITNQVLRVMAELPGREAIHIVAGVNLPLVIEIVLGDRDAPVGEVIGEAVARARDQLVYVNGIINA
jgi:fructoselysine and glucoselysine-specific PTS system IIA component